MHVRTANGCGGDAHQGIVRADIRDFFLDNFNPTFAQEYGSFHHIRHFKSPFVHY
jgi:hypothetical protein